VSTAEDLSRAGVNVPVLVGGAALSRNFVDRSIAPAYAGTVAYAQDAMSGLDLAKQMVEPGGLGRLDEELRVRREKLALETANRPAPSPAAPAARSREVRILDSVPAPPDWERHVLANTPLEQIWRFVNPVMLYGRHFGVKGSAARALDTPAGARLEGTEAGRKARALKTTVGGRTTEARGAKLGARPRPRRHRGGPGRLPLLPRGLGRQPSRPLRRPDRLRGHVLRVPAPGAPGRRLSLGLRPPPRGRPAHRQPLPLRGDGGEGHPRAVGALQGRG